MHYWYLLEPISQNIVPNNRAMNVVNKSLTALYGGFRQYDRFCFQRQAIHWVKKDCEYFVGKYKSLEPAGGVPSSLIKALFLLIVIVQYWLTIEKHINSNKCLKQMCFLMILYGICFEFQVFSTYIGLNSCIAQQS